jgi:pimeloyl-ACP methyl ester carboxylesterase
VSDTVMVLHHGICHTREQFLPLIEELNRLGLHAAMIDQQSENAGCRRNCIGANAYCEGMAAAVRRIEKDTRKPVGGYVLHSMGALIGEEMQQKYPRLRRPTVLMAPIPVRGALPITLRILRRHPSSYLKAVLTLDIHSLAGTPERVRELFFDQRTPEEIVLRTAAQLKHAPFWIYCQLVLRWLVRPRIQNDRLAKMLLYSDTDEIFHPRQYARAQDDYPQLEQERVRGGHDFFIEHAKDAARLIAEFYQAA